MQEDIKMIEDVLKDKDTKFWIGTQGIQSIEKLIARYKELEKEKKELQKYMKDYLIPRSTINVVYIPKSKVKEAIHKYELLKIFEDNSFEGNIKKEGCNLVINALQELLED